MKSKESPAELDPIWLPAADLCIAQPTQLNLNLLTVRVVFDVVQLAAQARSLRILRSRNNVASAFVGGWQSNVSSFAHAKWRVQDHRWHDICIEAIPIEDIEEVAGHDHVCTPDFAL